jgi:hypothetical protein
LHVPEIPGIANKGIHFGRDTAYQRQHELRHPNGHHLVIIFMGVVKTVDGIVTTARSNQQNA